MLNQAFTAQCFVSAGALQTAGGLARACLRVLLRMRMKRPPRLPMRACVEIYATQLT